MRQSCDFVLTLLTLDHCNISFHAIRGIGFGEVGDAQGIAMKPSERDELPAEAEFGDVPYESLHLLISHACSVPVEGWGIIVCKHQMRKLRTNIVSELLRLFEDRLTRLHPNHVGIWGESLSTLRAIFIATLDPVIPLRSPSRLPTEERLAGSELLCKILHCRQRECEIFRIPFLLGITCKFAANQIREHHFARTFAPITSPSCRSSSTQRL